jgi:hypothetical protein
MLWWILFSSWGGVILGWMIGSWYTNGRWVSKVQHLMCDYNRMLESTYQQALMDVLEGE